METKPLMNYKGEAITATQQWEYMQIKVLFNSGVEAEDLNKYGKQGWELITRCHDQVKRCWYFIFKRQLPKPAEVEDD